MAVSASLADGIKLLIGPVARRPIGLLGRMATEPDDVMGGVATAPQVAIKPPASTAMKPLFLATGLPTLRAAATIRNPRNQSLPRGISGVTSRTTTLVTGMVIAVEGTVGTYRS